MRGDDGTIALWELVTDPLRQEGATESAVAACICICAVRPSNAENGTDPMIPEVGWPANGRYLSAQLAHRTEAESATSKPIP